MKQLALFAMPRFKYLVEHIYRGSDGFIHVAFKSTSDYEEAMEWFNDHSGRGYLRVFQDDRQSFKVIETAGDPQIIGELNAGKNFMEGQS